jgi:Protein of unknown function (DUF2975)
MSGSSLPHDPLLAATTLLIWVVLAVAAFAGVLCALIAPSLMFPGIANFAKITIGGQSPAAAEMPRAAAALATAAGICALVFLGGRKLLAIIASVAEGDPMTADNAGRFAALGWIAAAINGVGMAVAALAAPFQADGDGGFGIDLSGLLLVMLLFILARVFRVGAAMRADLDGTI